MLFEKCLVHVPTKSNRNRHQPVLSPSRPGHHSNRPSWSCRSPPHCHPLGPPGANRTWPGSEPGGADRLCHGGASTSPSACCPTRHKAVVTLMASFHLKPSSFGESQQFWSTKTTFSKLAKGVPNGINTKRPWLKYVEIAKGTCHGPPTRLGCDGPEREKWTRTAALWHGWKCGRRKLQIKTET